MAIFLKGWRSPARRAKLRSASSKWFNSAPHKEVVSRSGTQDRPPNPSSVGAQHALDVLQSRARCALTKSLGQGLGRRLGLLPPLPGARLAFNPRVGAPGPLGSEQQASGQRGTRAARVASRGRCQLAGMAPAAASGGSTLPSGFSVFTTFPDLLFIFEFVFGGLVWILIASSLVPIALVQGWVMFVSVFCFVATTTLLILYIIGAHGGETSWIALDAAYHCIAAMFYLSASVLEALATIYMQEGFTFKHYHENISAVVFAYVVTLLYVIHALYSLIRWKSS